MGNQSILTDVVDGNLAGAEVLLIVLIPTNEFPFFQRGVDWVGSEINLPVQKVKTIAGPRILSALY